jgi:parallel beta-helix repeat protein
MTRKGLTSAILLASLAAAAATAGPLSPPSGPVTSTSKPLAEVEPRVAVNATNTPESATALHVISQPGSYYLTGNLTGVSGRDGILITASNVTLDLSGFTLTGVPGSKRGIYYTVGLQGVVIVNGTVTAWGEGGVYTTGGGYGGRMERIHANANNGDGIVVNNSMIVSNCSATDNTGNGIETFTSAAVTNCTASRNGNHGLATTVGGIFTDCVAYDNAGNGFTATFTSSTIERCVASRNGGHGFSLSSNSKISFCNAYENGLNGIVVSSNCRAFSNHCTSNGQDAAGGAGIRVNGSDNRIEGNVCNTSDRGIDVGNAGNVVIRNTCTGNGTNWLIIANNVVGPIIDRSAPASAAINGNSAPDSTGSTHPNANFTF